MAFNLFGKNLQKLLGGRVVVDGGVYTGLGLTKSKAGMASSLKNGCDSRGARVQWRNQGKWALGMREGHPPSARDTLSTHERHQV